ncbi:chaperonin 10-like protein [Mycena crocata]|nr:chaperonin 10-like protein [Mycena crocata]
MSQLALLFESPTSLVIKSRPISEPGNGLVQVRVEAAAINPIDQKILDYAGMGFIQTYPTVLGLDAAGEVTKLGPDVTKFKIGDRVAFCAVPTLERGAFQQYTLADVRYTTKIPATADFDSAATIPVGLRNGTETLYDQLKLTAPWLGGEGKYKGEKIVILGGSSSMGSYVIQLAALSGLEVITTSSSTHFAYLKSLGATTVIDRSAPDAAKQILAAAGGAVKYAVDAVALPETQLVGVEVTAPQGTLVVLLPPTPETKSAAEAKGVTVSLRIGGEGRFYDERLWDAVEGFIERGVIKFNRATVIPGGLRGWEEGFRLYREGKVSGTKLVLRPQETVTE